MNTTPSGHCSCRSAATGPVPRIRTRSSLPFLSLVCSNENAPAFYDLREVSIPNEPSKNMITTSLDNPFTNIYVYIHILSIQVDLPESVTMVLPFPISIDIFQDISGNSSLAPFHLPMLWTSMGNPHHQGMTNDQASEWSRVRTTLLDVCVSVPSTVALNFAFFPPNTCDYPRHP